MIGMILSIPLFLTLCIVFCIQTHPAYAQDHFLLMPIRVEHTPTICAIEPQSDPSFPTLGKQLFTYTENAVLDWKTKLNQGLGKHAVWNINLLEVPLAEQKQFDYTKCDVTIHYLPSPENSDEGFVAAGITIPNFETGKTNIEIYYLDVQPNWQMVEWTVGDTTYYYYKETPIYTGLVATSTQLDETIRHEIGHSFGLGHYIVSNEENHRIVTGQEDMPSIMIDTLTVLGATHFDITLLDISQIKSIYGMGGFDNLVTSNPGHQRVHLLSTDKENYQADERINLSIDTTSFNNDTGAAILVIDSNNHLMEDFGISKENSTLMLGDKYHKDNKYWIELINPFTGAFDYTSFSVGTQIPQQTNTTQVLMIKPSVQIPPWVKNSAKWWSEGSIGDNDFVKGIQYLITQGIMKIPPSQPTGSETNQIPRWVKNNAGWWADGQISDDDFVKAIQYLIDNGIIKV